MILLYFLFLRHKIKILPQKHLVQWIRFVQENRPHKKFTFRDTVEFDFRNLEFIRPHHVTPLACLVEEYSLTGAKIRFKYRRTTTSGHFLENIKLIQYWNRGFNKNHCFVSTMGNTLPIWQIEGERITSYSERIASFYSVGTLAKKDLSLLNLTIVEALNNVVDHSDCMTKGFIFTHYNPKKSYLEISICDFGTGIPKKVNTFFASKGKEKLNDYDALQQALMLGFTTKSKPNNGGYGLDNILTNVTTTDGEILILSNQAFYSKRIKNNNRLATIYDNIKLRFGGTYINITLNTEKFQDKGVEEFEEMSML